MRYFLITIIALFAFANAAASGNFIYATDFGVVAGDANLDNVAMQDAMDECETQSGGTVIAPAGEILIGNGGFSIKSSACSLIGMGHGGTFFSNADPNSSHQGTVFKYVGDGGEPVIDLGDGTHLFTGIHLENFTIDGNYAMGVVGFRLNYGIINSSFHKLHILRTTTASQVLGTGTKTSFNNKWVEVTFEHFESVGLDIYGDGNGSIVDRCKFINTYTNDPFASMRIGVSEYVANVSVVNSSFGATNVNYHILDYEGSGHNFSALELEASGNSTSDATALVRLGWGTRKVTGVSIGDGTRIFGNSKAERALWLNNVNGIVIAGVEVGNSFTGPQAIRNDTTVNGALFSTNFNGATPINSTSGFDIYYP